MPALALKLVHESPDNPRKHFDADELGELTKSVAQIGVLQPILVRPNSDGYEIVCGARRYRAAVAAGLEEIPVDIRQLTDLEAAVARLVENNQRADVTPLEEARAFRSLVDAGQSAAEISGRVSRPVRYVRDRLALLELPDDVLELVQARRFNLGAAVALARAGDDLIAEACAEIRKREAVTDGWNRAPDVWTLSMIRGLISRQYLSSAPWDLDDATLAPKGAGACASCPTSSLGQRDLFGTEQSTPFCLVQACYDERLEAFRVGWRAAREAEGSVFHDKMPAGALNAWDWLPGDLGAVLHLLEQVQVVPDFTPYEHDITGYKRHFTRARIADALEAAGRPEDAELVRNPPKPTPAPPARDWAAERAKTEEAREKAYKQIFDYVAGGEALRTKASRAALGAALLEAAVSVDGAIDELLGARDIKIDWTAEDEADDPDKVEPADRAALQKLAEGMSAQEVFALAVEAVARNACSYYGGGHIDQAFDGFAKLAELAAGGQRQVREMVDLAKAAT